MGNFKNTYLGSHFNPHFLAKVIRFAGIIVCLVLFAPVVAPAQNTTVIDSLQQALTKVRPEEKVRILIELCTKTRTSDPAKARKYATEALRISKELNNEKLVGDSYNSMGSTSLMTGEYRQAVEDYTSSLEIRERINDTLGVANTLNNLGIVYRRQGEYDKALDYYIQSLRKKELIGNKSDIAASLNNIGGLYYFQKNYVKARYYYEQVLQLAKELNDEESEAAGYNNLALIFFEQQDYGRAMEYNMLSLAIRKKNNDLLGIAACYNNVGRIYEIKKDLDNAQKHYFMALDCYSKAGDNASIANSLFNIGNLFIGKGDYGKAQSYLQESIEISRITGDKPQLRSAYYAMAECMYGLGRYKEGFQYQEKYIALNDSIYSEEGQSRMAEMEARYESDKKVKEIELLKKQSEIDELEQQSALEKEKIWRNVLVAGFVAILIITLLVYNRYKVKKRANDQLGEQKAKIEVQNMQLAQKNTEITDSIRYAKNIQEAILPPNTEMKKHLPDSFVLYKPKDIVSGDFYWLEHWGDRTLVAAVDCTGHGVPGAFMSIVGYNLLHQSVNNLGLTRPALILNALNKGVASMLHQGHEEATVKDGMDIALCSLDRNSKMLEFAGAYNSLYLVRRGELVEIKGDKFPVGMFMGDEATRFTNHELRLEEGDTMYIFSDGYADQFGGEKGKKFKYRQFQELLLSIQEKPMEEQRIILDRTIEAWRGSLEQVDDILVIGFRF